MNQVTEMLQLAPGASESDAVARLSRLFEMMGGQPGFLRAEVLRRQDAPAMLLVLHAWERLEDWQAFQTSDAKTEFSASRPASLYSFVPCGMNWRLEAGHTEGEARFLRREVLRGPAPPLSGEGVVASATLAYEDAEPEYRGATLRLTRLDSAPDAPGGGGALAGEVYESLYRFAAARLEARATT